jgi:hypothetical protein
MRFRCPPPPLPLCLSHSCIVIPTPLPLSPSPPPTPPDALPVGSSRLASAWPCACKALLLRKTNTLYPDADSLVVVPQGITQIIDKESGVVDNLAEFTIAGTWDGYLNVEGTVTPVVPETGEAIRVDVRFTAFSFKLGPLPALKIPLAAISPKVVHPDLLFRLFFFCCCFCSVYSFNSSGVTCPRQGRHLG